MNSSFARLLLLPLLATAAALAGRAATPVIGSQLFQETNARIDDLFQHRNNPPKPPAPLDDPFRIGNAPLASAMNLSGAPGVPAPLGVSDEAVLRRAAGVLTFGGILRIGDTEVLVINKASYKQGGILSVRLQGSPVYLRIISITGDSVTLGLNEARLTLHF
ncbi:MAG: hypothetical protein ABI222_10755 [Opitutaceae bacterium]